MQFKPIRFAALLALAGLVGGCFGEGDRPLEVIAIGAPGSLQSTSPRMPLATPLLRAATVEGLVGFDEQGRVVPAVADRWIVTDDGLSYIFRLRDGKWGDGTAITAETARTALLQAIGGQRGQALGRDLVVISEVRVMARRVVEIRLRHAMPDFLQLLAQPELGLIQARRGTGPMSGKRSSDSELKLDGMLLRLIAPEDRGMVPEEDWAERTRRLRFSALPASRAIELFNSGKADLVLGGGFADFPRLDSAGLSRGTIKPDPVLGLFGFAVTHAAGFLSLPENREAIAMAIDRDALAGAFNLGGWTLTTRVVNPGLEGDPGSVSERWAGRSLDDRRAQAASRVAAWKGAGNDPAPLRLALPAGPGSDVLFERIAADLKAIGLDTRRVRLDQEADLRLIDTVARYAAPAWFLDQLSCAHANALCSTTADLFAERAMAEPDPAKRADLYAEAEAKLTMENSYIPIGVPIRWSLVGPRVTGFAPNRWNVHPLMPMAMIPR